MFESKTGLLLEGKIIPATEGVKVKVTNSKTMQEVATVTTDKNGAYKVGPLYDD